MDINVSNAEPAKIKTGCLVLPVTNQRKLTGCTAAVDKASDGYLSDILKQGDLSTKLAASLTLHQVPNVAAKRVVLINTAKNKSTDKLNARDFDKIASAQARALACLLYTSPSPRD